MASIEIELTDGEAAQLETVATARAMSVPELAQRWIRERLVHERERAQGGGSPMSPRARREEGEGRS